MKGTLFRPGKSRDGAGRGYGFERRIASPAGTRWVASRVTVIRAQITVMYGQITVIHGAVTAVAIAGDRVGDAQGPRLSRVLSAACVRKMEGGASGRPGLR